MKSLKGKVNGGNKRVTLSAGKIKGPVSIKDTARRIKP